jgi:hypothetical protein
MDVTLSPADLDNTLTTMCVRTLLLARSHLSDTLSRATELQVWIVPMACGPSKVLLSAIFVIQASTAQTKLLYLAQLVLMDITNLVVICSAQFVLTVMNAIKVRH